MDELIQLILALPPITLSKTEWRTSARLINLDNMDSAEDFMQKLKETELDHTYDADRLTDLMVYLDTWFKVQNTVATLFIHICVLFKYCYHKDIGGDDEPDIYLYLLKKHQKDFKLIKDKIETILRLEEFGHSARILTLICGLCNMISEENPAFYNSDEYKKNKHIGETIANLLPEANKIISFTKFAKQLLDASQVLKEQLGRELKVQLNAKHPALFKRYFQGDSYKSDEQAINDLSNQQYMSKCETTTAEDKDELIANIYILNLIRKYLAAYDLTLTIKDPSINPEKHIHVFMNKYHEYLDLHILKKPNQHLPTLFIPTALLGRTADEYFHIKVQDIVSQNRQHDPKEATALRHA